MGSRSGGAHPCEVLIEGAAFEVVPESRESRPLLLQPRDLTSGLHGTRFRATQLLLCRLPNRKLPPVVLGEMLPALALVLLAHEVLDELLDQLAAGLPELA